MMLLRQVLFLAVCGLIHAARASDPQFCISTLNDFQQSLVNRTVNLDSLSFAFFPSNHQPSISFIVHYYFCTRDKLSNSSEIFCDDIEEWANDENAGRKPTKDFSKNFSYTFLWNTSPINLFIRPDLLASLSLFTFQVKIFSAHIILDKYCYDEHDINPTVNASSSDPLDVCRKPTSIILLLESLTSDVRKPIQWNLRVKDTLGPI